MNAKSEDEGTEDFCPEKFYPNFYPLSFRFTISFEKQCLMHNSYFGKRLWENYR